MVVRRLLCSLPLLSAFVVVALAAACTRPAPPGAGSGDAAFMALASTIIADHLQRHPSQATDLGIHSYDLQLDDFSRQAVTDELRALQDFRRALVAIDPMTLSFDRQLDREQLVHAMDSTLLERGEIRPWAKDPDVYSGGITNAAYTLIKRDFASAAIRLRALIARERKMPGALLEARKNLDNPPRVSTEIAIEQIDGNQNFFKHDVPAAFPEVTDPALSAEFTQANGAVIAALGDYKTFLELELLPKSTGTFALGPAIYARKLAADEMIDLSLGRLLALAEADRQQNENAFNVLARRIDPSKSTAQVLEALQADHPAAEKLLKTTQDTLDSLRQFIVDRHIVTIPPSAPATVKETPPFMRSTTSASMDTPGPFESVAAEAYYNMTLPDPRWKAPEQADFMRQWYYAAIANVSVHEVYPGHYLQFLYAKQFPSDVRKVFGATSNVEGWAHYCEQMMLDEGFHADEPKYRLAQLQDALLRDARFIVGIRMHTQGMSVEEATTFFERLGHQPHPVAVSEAKRGTSDPTYGYYTMGKLMILKLRDDYKAKLGPAYSLQKFHDAFIKLGPLPLPLMRRAMLGEQIARAVF